MIEGMSSHILALLEPHLLRFVGESHKGSATKDFDYVSRHTVRQLQQVLDEALVDFHRSLLERQQCKVSGNEPP